MKKYICLFFALLVVFSCAGCADKNDGFSNNYTTEGNSASGEYTVADYGFDLPEGFTAANGIVGMYESPDYPDDSSNFYASYGDADPYFGSYDVELMQTALSQSLTQQMGSEITVTVDSLEYITVSELPAYRMELHYAVSGLALRQLVVSVNADYNYTFTWTQVGEADWMEAFRASADSLWFTLE